MDKMDRMLKLLPRHTPSADLSARIRAVVHRRYVQRMILRHALALSCGIGGLILASPILTRLDSDWSSLSASWLIGGWNMMNMGSLEALQNLWNGMFTVQASISSLLAISVLGILLMAFGMFFELDRRIFQMPL